MTGARADGGGAVFDAAVGVDPADSRAGIHALGVDAGRSAARAVTVAQALSTTRRVRVPEVTLQHHKSYAVNLNAPAVSNIATVVYFKFIMTVDESFNQNYRFCGNLPPINKLH